MAITPERINQIEGEQGLFDFLREELDWQVSETPDTYPFYPDELGLTPEEARLLESVSQIANFEEGQPYGVFLVKFQRGGVYRSVLRRVLRGLSETRKGRDAGLPAWRASNLIFICTANFQDFTFARFEGKSHTKATLSLFGWEKGDAALRTLCEFNLPCLKMPPVNLLGEADWTKAKWGEAWSVEKVTREFFRDYRRVFDATEERIREANPNVSGDWRLFTQRLFNRLLFMQFLSKKGWLVFEGRRDYLRALYDRAEQRGENFYSERLYWAFFYGLGTLQESREVHNLEKLKERRGEVPYLNGGLFEMANATDARNAVKIDNSVFKEIFYNLFTPYNFTVHESTPLYIEVAVDPEMLGKVFEELVTGRHESGSYYTPRGIVSFMCREALKGYLGGYSELVDEHKADAISVPVARQLLQRLQDLKAVDPACGSGAYLLGLLHELHAVTRLLDTRAEELTAKDDYHRKLSIIQNNLYGVDLDEFAVNIARLRLWLALAVEFEGDTPEPLPNLDFKIEVGDSLSAPDPASSEQIDHRASLIPQFQKQKADYANPYYTGDKSELKKGIQELKADIAGWTHPGKVVQGFDWAVEFAEVFASKPPLATIGGAFNFGQELAERDEPGGFDIVLANPPYVRQELIKELKPTLKKVYPQVYTGTADLYCFFYARAIQILKPGGMLAFISPNKWFRAGYGANLRKHIAETCRVESITDFGELPVFEAAATFPMVFIAQKGRETAPLLFTQVKTLEPPYPDVLELVQAQGQRLPKEAINGADWTLTDSVSADRLRTMEKAGVPLGEYVKGQIFYGVKTGFNTAFVIDGAKRAELIAQDPNSAEIIKPLAVGDDVRRWRIEQKDRWLIFTRRGVDIERYPAIKAHMSQWKAELTPKVTSDDEIGRKPGRYKWYEIQDEVAYYDAFDKPKIVYPEIAMSSRFAFDTSNIYPIKTVFSVSTDDLYLLGVLNSASAWEYLKQVCSVLGDENERGRLTLQSIFVSKLPIPTASDVDKSAISALVQKCLDAKGAGCEAWEAEIDARVAALYGL